MNNFKSKYIVCTGSIKQNDIARNKLYAIQDVTNQLEELIAWRTDTPPIEEELIVTVKDETGDSPYYYTAAGWYAGDFWIVDNSINRQVIAWKPLPKPYKG